MQKYISVSHFITDYSQVPQTDENATLGSVINDLPSSHSAVFVFSQDKRFVGMVSPQQVLYSHRLPYSTKVKNAMIEPMHINKSSEISTVAEYMCGTRIYTIPVFSDGELVGVVTADSILKGILANSQLFERVADVMVVREPLTISVNAQVADVYSALKTAAISRIVLVDEDQRIEGIVTRKDLFPVFTMPDQQRTKSNTSVGRNSGLRIRRQTFDQEKSYRRNEQAHMYMTRFVQTADFALPKKKLLKKLLESEQNSLILVRENRAVGLFSRYDVLKAVSTLLPQFQVPIQVEFPASTFSEQLYQSVGLQLLEVSVKKLHSRDPIRSAAAHFKKIKNSVGMTNLYECRVETQLERGPRFIGHSTEPRIDQALRAAVDRVEKQFRRSDST